MVQFAGPHAEPGARALLEHRSVFVGGIGRVTAPVYAREHLVYGNQIDGPALVEQYDSTTLIGAGWRAAVDAFGNLVLERRATV